MMHFMICASDAIQRGLADRLHRATIHSVSDLNADSPEFTACDAVAFLDGSQVPAERLESCLSAKKHILLLAGPWQTCSTLERLLQQSRTTAIQIAVVNPDRFLPSRQLIRQQCDAGKFGEPGLIRMHRWEPTEKEGLEASEKLPASLLRDLDIAISLVGKTPNLIYAVNSSANEHDYPRRQFLQIHLGFTQGAMALIDYTNRLPAGDSYVSLSLIGATGAAYADDHQNMQLIYRGNHPQSIRVPENEKQIALVVQNFIDGIMDCRDFSSSVVDWIQVLKLEKLIQQSLTSRRAIPWEDR